MSAPFISTVERDDGAAVITLHQDKHGGRPLPRLAASLPRTVLSAANAAESPTALLARREMQSWRPPAVGAISHAGAGQLRSASATGAERRAPAVGPVSSRGRGPGRASKYGEASGGPDAAGEAAAAAIYGRIATRLAELVPEVRRVWVDRDERRELLTLYVSGHDGTPHPARALSDGTLRFLALAILLEIDPESPGLLCLEEPENGIHPERIPAMLRLLEDIPADTGEQAGADNPLRQVIINTHSPSVVGQVPDESLLMADLRLRDSGHGEFREASLRPWRAPGGRGRLRPPNRCPRVSCSPTSIQFHWQQKRRLSLAPQTQAAPGPGEWPIGRICSRFSPSLASHETSALHAPLGRKAPTTRLF